MPSSKAPTTKSATTKTVKDVIAPVPTPAPVLPTPVPAADIIVGTTQLVDPGVGTTAPGIPVQVGVNPGDNLDINIVNAGSIQGRGQAPATDPLAGDGIRLFPGAAGVSFSGDIVNKGSIASESTQAQQRVFA